MLALLIIETCLVFAATPTDAPGALQGDVIIQSKTSGIVDQLYEQTVDVGNRNYLSHQLVLTTEFGVLDQLSFATSIPHYYERYNFSDVRLMDFDHKRTTGSYVEADTSKDVTRSGNGFGGSWLGVYLTPFHDKIFHNRGDQGSWKVGLGYRFANNNPFVTADNSGTRGAGVGASAFTMYGAFSKRNRLGYPYLVMDLELGGRWQGDIRNDNGTVLIDNAELYAPDKAELQPGIEIKLWEDRAFGSYVTLDLFSRLGYHGWTDIPSGVLLPNTLPAYNDLVMTQSELLFLDGGLGVNTQINSLYAFRFTGTYGTRSAQQIEHLYDVTAKQSKTWSALVEMKFRYRNTAR